MHAKHDACLLPSPVAAPRAGAATELVVAELLVPRDPWPWLQGIQMDSGCLDVWSQHVRTILLRMIGWWMSMNFRFILHWTHWTTWWYMVFFRDSLQVEMLGWDRRGNVVRNSSIRAAEKMRKGATSPWWEKWQPNGREKWWKMILKKPQKSVMVALAIRIAIRKLVNQPWDGLP